MLTVGPIAENCFLLRREGSDQALDRRPRRGGGADPRRARGDRRQGRGDPRHPLPLRPHRRGRAGGEGDRRAGLLPGDRDRRCSPTSWPSSPATASGPTRATRPTRRSRAARRSSLPGSSSTSSSRPATAPATSPTRCATRTAIFSGDVLFQGSVGRVDLPGGDGPTLIASIRSCSTRTRTRPPSIPATWATTTLGRRAGDQPLPRRAGPS